MTGRGEMQGVIARALCLDGHREPCAMHQGDAAMVAAALVEAGYFQTDDGVVGSGGGASPSAGTGASAPSSPLREVLSRAFAVSEFNPDLGDHEFAGERADEGDRLADVALAAMDAADFIVWGPNLLTGGGAGETQAAASAVPLDPAAQADPAHATPAPPSPRRFLLIRHEDKTGLTGTGPVAEGCRWTDGTASMRWRGKHPSTVAWANVERIIAVHGHQGSTVIEWLDGEDGGIPWETDRQYSFDGTEHEDVWTDRPDGGT